MNYYKDIIRNINIIDVIPANDAATLVDKIEELEAINSTQAREIELYEEQTYDLARKLELAEDLLNTLSKWAKEDLTKKNKAVFDMHYINSDYYHSK